MKNQKKNRVRPSHVRYYPRRLSEFQTQPPFDRIPIAITAGPSARGRRVATNAAAAAARRVAYVCSDARKECTAADAGRSKTVGNHCGSTRLAAAPVGTIMSLVISGGATDHHRDVNRPRGGPAQPIRRHYDDARCGRRVQERRRRFRAR